MAKKATCRLCGWRGSGQWLASHVAQRHPAPLSRTATGASALAMTEATGMEARRKLQEQGNWYVPSAKSYRLTRTPLLGKKIMSHTLIHSKRTGYLVETGWGEKVTVVLHRVPEDEGFEGGFEAVTMAGVPHGVSVAGSDRDSAEAALKHLISGLTAFGFVGLVAVEDVTMVRRSERYEIRVD